MMAIHDLHFRHPHTRTAVLNGISFEAPCGKLTAVLGPNGSGKTTLFKCIAGLWKAGSGDIAFEGRSIRNHSHSKSAKIIAVVPQEHEPPFPYSVFDAVIVGRAAHVGMFSSPSQDDCARAHEAIDRVGIAHLANRPYTQ
jgi:iron complex transport system ATP-binding protein